MSTNIIPRGITLRGGAALQGQGALAGAAQTVSESLTLESDTVSTPPWVLEERYADSIYAVLGRHHSTISPEHVIAGHVALRAYEDITLEEAVKHGLPEADVPIKSFYIGSLVVLETFRGDGLGKTLIGAAIAQARARAGGKPAIIHARTAKLGLFASFGMQPDEKIAGLRPYVDRSQPDPALKKQTVKMLINMPGTHDSTD